MPPKRAAKANSHPRSVNAAKAARTPAEKSKNSAQSSARANGAKPVKLKATQPELTKSYSKTIAPLQAVCESQTLKPQAFAQDITKWFTRSHRELPWRATPRNPYHALVSEAMLQQTQVSRVIVKFNAFIAKFPTVDSLARASSDQVTQAWAGLGYYRRAHNLHRAAQMVVSDFGGNVPRDVAELLKLPGIGRYTAGAIASIAYNNPAPIVDGNVMRVLLRVYGQPLAQEAPATQRWAWETATTLVSAAKSPAAFNEGLMELGATICTPGPSPACSICPVRSHCIAFRDQLQASIPQPKDSKPVQHLRCACLVIPNAQGHLLFEKRPTGGLWSGLWQLPTLQTTPQGWPEIKEWLENTSRSDSPLDGVRFSHLLSFDRTLTHRQIHFELWTCPPPPPLPPLPPPPPPSQPPPSSRSKTPRVSRLGHYMTLDHPPGLIGPASHPSNGVERQYVPLETAHLLGLSNAQREALRLYEKATRSLFPT